MNTLIAKALDMASKGHALQKRKYDGTPYILHLMEVSSLLTMAKSDEETLVAGLLHDALEDTKITKQQIKDIFGQKVENMVTWLSDDKSLTIDARHAITLHKMAMADANVVNIKISDLISNMCSIPLDWDELKRSEYLERCKNILDIISCNPSTGSAELKSLANFVFILQTKDVPVYDQLCNWALAGKLYWSVTKRGFLHLSNVKTAIHEGTRVESNLDKLFELGLMHRLALTSCEPISIRETSFFDGGMTVIQNKHAFVHSACFRVRLK
ncbi:HD domain-containing protein [Paraglaciecola aestuariivivens]